MPHDGIAKESRRIDEGLRTLIGLSQTVFWDEVPC
jgi:hypothetical protein